MDQDTFQGRQVIRRQFHDERRRFALEQRVLEHHAGQNRQRDTDEVERKNHVLRVVREERGTKQHIDRQTRAAGHERRHGDRHQTVTAMFERARGHDCRHVAAEADNQRHEGFARQADPAHEAVHDEGRTRHIAGTFEHREEEVEEADHRDEGRYRLQTAADTLGQQHVQPFRRTQTGQQFTKTINEQGGGELIEEIDEGATDVDGEHEHQVHHHEKDRDAEHAVQHHAVDAVRDVARDLATDPDAGVRHAIGQAVTGVGNEDIEIVAELLCFLLRLLRQRFAHRLPRQIVAFQQTHGQPAR